MRKIVNISLTAELDRQVNEEVKKGDYATKSEFFRDLLRVWKEEQVLREIRASKNEIRAGKGRILKSLKNLR